MYKSKTGIERNPAFFGLSLFQILVMFRRGVFYTFLAIYLRIYLGLSVTATSLYATLPSILSAIFQMTIWGGLSDYHQDRRTFMIIGEIIPGIFLLVVFWLHNQTTSLLTAGYILIAGFSFIEIFWSMSNLSFTTILTDIYNPSQRNVMMNYLIAIGGISRMIGIYCSGLWYRDGQAFRGGLFFYIASGVIFLSILPLFLLPKRVQLSEIDNSNGNPLINIQEVQETRSISKQKSKEKIVKNHIHDIRQQDTRIKFPRIEKISEIPPKLLTPRIPIDRIFIFLLFGLAIINLGRGSVGVIYPTFLVLQSPGLGFTAPMIALNTNIQSFATIIFGILMGVLSWKMSFTQILFWGLTFGVIGSIGTILIPYPLGIYLCGGLLAIAEVMIGSGSYVYASILISPRKRAKFFGIYNATFSIAGGVGASVLISPIIDQLILPISTPAQILHAFQIGLWIAVGLIFLGIIILGGLELRIAVPKSSHMGFK